MKEDNLYIKVLIYCADKDTFTLVDIIEDLKLTDQQAVSLERQIKRNDLFFPVSGATNADYKKERKNVFCLSVEDSFRLLEYEELQEAREASKSATRWATVALVVSILSFVASIFFNIITLKPSL